MTHKGYPTMNLITQYRLCELVLILGSGLGLILYCRIWLPLMCQEPLRVLPNQLLLLCALGRGAAEPDSEPFLQERRQF